MALLKMAKRFGAFMFGLLAVGLLPMAGAQAALPAGVTSAIDDAGADLLAAGTAVIVALIGFWAIRKVGQKMGWW